MSLISLNARISRRNFEVFTRLWLLISIVLVNSRALPLVMRSETMWLRYPTLAMQGRTSVHAILTLMDGDLLRLRHWQSQK
jgi:hypothetical protein